MVSDSSIGTGFVVALEKCPQLGTVGSVTRGGGGGVEFRKGLLGEVTFQLELEGLL